MKLRTWILLSCMALPLSASAYFQIAGSKVRSPGTQADYIVNDTPGSLKINPKYTLYPAKGTLYKTVKAYTSKHGWKLRWKVQHRYAIANTYKIAGPSFQAVLNNLLSNYMGVRARYNKRRHVVSVGLKSK